MSAPADATTIGERPRRKAMKVCDLMTRDVVTVTPETTLKDAAELLVRHRISGVPVVDDDGGVVGVLSEADVLVKEGGERRRDGMLGWLLEPGDAFRDKLAARTVGEAMTAPPLTIGPRAPVHKAAARMVEDEINRLPVVDDAGRIVGIVSRADLVRAFTRSDDEILDEIRSEILRRTFWLEPSAVEVRVEAGAVELAGEVETTTDAELLPRLVRRVPGVVSVHAELQARTASAA
jgi:CBS domain-containing protein